VFDADLQFVLRDAPDGGDVEYTAPSGLARSVPGSRNTTDQDLALADGDNVAGVTTTLLIAKNALPELRRLQSVCFKGTTYTVKDIRPAYAGRMQRLYLVEGK
jgi:hypothetical protein